MNSTKIGLYIADIGSDDGSRLTVDNILVYNDWKDQAYTNNPRLLMNLTGASSLVLDYYENAINNRFTFQNLTLVLTNRLNANTTQSVCLGNSGTPISGDIFPDLSGSSYSGLSIPTYQWAYSTTSSSGPWTDISGATASTYTPTFTAAPFNSATTYYFIRKASVQSANNTGIANPYVATNQSNAATITVGALPVAPTAGNNGPVCVGSSLSLTASTVAGATYSWTGPNSFTSSSQNPTVSASATTAMAGLYSVTATMSGCTSSAGTTTATVNAIPTTPTESNTGPICAGSTLTLNTPTVTGATYSWTGPNSFTSTSQNPSITNATTAATGTYSVTITVSSCPSLAGTTIATVNAIPTITGTTPGSTCGTGAMTIGATASAGTINWYSASTGGTSLGTGTSYTTPSISTSTTYYVDATNNGCTTGSRTAVTATVNAIPSVPTTTGAFICIGTVTGTTLSASGAVVSQKYVWYSASTGGTPLKTSTSYKDNTYTTPVIGATTNYWVSILSAGGCESSRTQVTATYPSICTDPQTPATDSWIGYVYDGINLNSYYGHYTEPETFNESFGGNTNCFGITSNSNPLTIYTETFSVKYLMNSTKKGLWVVDLGSDDGSRLTVDGTLIYNNWGDQSFSTRPSVLMNLTGSSSLEYDFYENGGANQVIFQAFTQVLANTLSNNTTQIICLGNSGSAISGDVYVSLPTGITLSGTGYQWT